MDGESPQRASQLQEAIDTVVQAFDYPSSISVDYEAIESTKRTTFEVTTADGSVTYELVYEGTEDEDEPEISRIE